VQQEKAERITITLPPDMLTTIKQKVSVGAYGSTSELIRNALRLWQKKEEEHEARLSLIRHRLKQSVKSGKPVPLDTAFDGIRDLHNSWMQEKS
jgi:antitoxin ParD1/3/4